MRLAAWVVVAFVATQFCRAEDDAAWKARVEAELKSLRQENATIKQENADLKKRLDTNDSRARAIKGSDTVQKALDKAISNSGEGGRHIVFLAPDQPDVRGTGLFTDLQFLYMKPHEDNQVAAVRNSSVTVLTPPSISVGVDTKEINIDSGYDPGFRMGIGYRLPKDGWEVLAEYTWFRGMSDLSLNDSQNHPRTPSVGLLGTNGVGIYPPFHLITPIRTAVHPTGFSDGKVEMDTKYQVLDLEASRNTRISESFSIRATGGGRLMWFDREYQGRFDALRPDPALPNGQTFLYRRDEDFFGYGVRGGLEGTWKFSHGLSLFGGGSGSLLLGDLNHSYGESMRSTPIAFSFRLHGGKLAVVSGSDFHIGANWDHRFSERVNMKISAGYEFADWYGLIQDQSTTVGSSSASAGRHQGGDFSLHGMFLKFRLDF